MNSQDLKMLKLGLDGSVQPSDLLGLWLRQNAPTATFDDAGSNETNLTQKLKAALNQS